jgi:hypothetical protein
MPRRTLTVALAISAAALALAQPGPAPPQPALPSCADVVAAYWAQLGNGNLPAALNLTSADVVLTWPGNTTLLPMAGAWQGPAGIAGFFTAVSSLFDFRICSGPDVMEVGAAPSALAYATWRECSVLIATGGVPCPNATNQALYTCSPSPSNSSALLISAIDVNIDNLCVAEAVCAARQVGAAAAARAVQGDGGGGGVGSTGSDDEAGCGASGLVCPACGA